MVNLTIKETPAIDKKRMISIYILSHRYRSLPVVTTSHDASQIEFLTSSPLLRVGSLESPSRRHYQCTPSPPDEEGRSFTRIKRQGPSSKWHIRQSDLRDCSGVPLVLIRQGLKGMEFRQPANFPTELFYREVDAYYLL